MNSNSESTSNPRSKFPIRLGIFLLFVGFAFLVAASVAKAPALLTISMAGLFLGVGFVTLVYEVFLLRDFEHLSKNNLDRIATALVELRESLGQRFELTKAQNRVGMVDASEDCTTYDYGPLLLDSRALVVVLNDGRTWASVHRDRLRKRFADPSKATTFILCHPESAMLPVLARKGSTTIDVIQSRIAETIQLLLDIKQPETVLELLGHHLFNPFTLVLGDENAIITPYFFSRGGRTVPAMKFQDLGGPCYFRDIVDDVERLRIDARDISNLGSPRPSLESQMGQK